MKQKESNFVRSFSLFDGPFFSTGLRKEPKKTIKRLHPQNKKESNIMAYLDLFLTE